MTDYKLGTVAMVTHNEKRMRVISLGGSRWATPCCWSTEKVTDVTPLACFEAIRKDADALVIKASDGRSQAVINRVRAAIIEQTPEPEPEPEPAKRWRAEGRNLFDRGSFVAAFTTAGRAECAADTFNAAEPTS